MKRFSTALIMFLAAFSASSPHAAAKPTVAPYGSWRSPISAHVLVQGAVRFGDVATDGDTLYWIEARPEAEGRCAIVRRTADGKIEDVLPAPFSARTLVHEYGGGALAVSDGVVFFINYADQRLWRFAPGKVPQSIAPESKLRFADFVRDAPRNRLIAVCEDHSQNDHEPANRIVAVNLADGKVTTLVEGADFYSNPRVSPDGLQLSWLEWHHPNMPWDGTELFVAPLAGDGSIGKPRKVAGGSDESVFQPSWSPDGTLYFVSDRSNWWNLYAERTDKIRAPELHPRKMKEMHENQMRLYWISPLLGGWTGLFEFRYYNNEDRTRWGYTDDALALRLSKELGEAWRLEVLDGAGFWLYAHCVNGEETESRAYQDTPADRTLDRSHVRYELNRIIDREGFRNIGVSYEHIPGPSVAPIENVAQGPDGIDGLEGFRHLAFRAAKPPSPGDEKK